jgi:hypothetical protein
MGTDTTFPSDLPIPQDDGACSHLTGSKMPAVSLPATSGDKIDVSSLSRRPSYSLTRIRAQLVKR